MKKLSGPEPHQIFFAGEETTAQLLNGKSVTVFVRELPCDYHRLVFTHAKAIGALVELCCYVRAGESAAGLGRVQPHPPLPEVLAAARFAHVPPPAGYWPVPLHWADNVRNASQIALYELAKKLNFTPAAKTGELLIAAEEWRAPLLLAADETLMPHVKKLSDLLISSLTSLSPPAAPTKPSSAGKPSPG